MVDQRPSIILEVRSDNAVTVPKEFRDKHEIEPGDDVELRLANVPEEEELSQEEFEELKEMAEKLF